MKISTININFTYMLFLIMILLPVSNTANAALIDDLRSEAASLGSSQSVTYVPISVDDIFIVIPAGTGLPADPGQDGDATIEGIDADGDGIRDDVEKLISTHYPDDPMARAYSYMIAKRLQKIIENKSSKTVFTQSLQEMSFFESCLDQLFPQENMKGGRLILPWVLNTYARSYAYLDALELLGGETLPATLSCQ